MKEFSNRIFLCPADELPATIESPFSGFDQLHSDVDIKPSLVQQERRGNPYYRFDLRTAFSDADQDVIDKYRNKRPLVMILFDTDGNSYQVGDSDYKIRAGIDTDKFVNVFNFSADILTDPFV